MVKESDFDYVETPVAELLADNEVLIRNLYFAFEPAMRGWLNDVKSYLPPVQIGDVMRAGTVGQVIESNNPDFTVGDYVSGTMGWQEYVIIDGKPGMTGAVNKVPEGVPPYLMLSALGTTGLTAYFGLLDLGKPGVGDVVVARRPIRRSAPGSNAMSRFSGDRSSAQNQYADTGSEVTCRTRTL